LSFVNAFTNTLRLDYLNLALRVPRNFT